MEPNIYNAPYVWQQQTKIKNGDEGELGTIRDFTVFNQMFQNSSLFTYNQLGIRYWQ
jgi:hypothetical protein